MSSALLSSKAHHPTRTNHREDVCVYGVLAVLHEHLLSSAKEEASQRSREKRQWGCIGDVLNKQYWSIPWGVTLGQNWLKQRAMQVFSEHRSLCVLSWWWLLCRHRKFLQEAITLERDSWYIQTRSPLCNPGRDERLLTGWNQTV